MAEEKNFLAKGRRLGSDRFKDKFSSLLRARKAAGRLQKMQVVAWCPYAKIVMEDIILSKDTIHSIELVEGAKPVRDMPWAKDGLTWKVNVYDIDLTLSNDLVVEPTRMPATLRIVASASCTDIFSYMGIKTDFPIADGPIASRFE